MTIFAIYWLGVAGICLYADARDEPSEWLWLALAWPSIPIFFVVAMIMNRARSRQ